MMKVSSIISLVALASVSLSVSAQEVVVTPVDIFAGAKVINPVVVDSTLYFSSNIKNDVVVNYYAEDDSRLYQLYKVHLKNRKPSGRIESFMQRSNRPYNQTAVAFDANGGIHVTQNNMSAATDKGSPLGIFDYASDMDKSDGRVALERTKSSNVAYPSYSSDGSFMIFASDAQGGEGSSDLYYCEMVDGRWSEAKSMGPVINTAGAETAPFVHPSGKIFFSSNGREDSRKLDIYYTFRTDDGFAEPVRFDIKVNSIGDDYGIFYSDNEEWGYFTSNRHGSERLYYFSQKFPDFPEENEMEEENYCFTFFEESVENYDPNEFGFKWTISDGHQYEALEADHCFDGPGVYGVGLSVLDKTSGEELFTIAEYEMELKKPEQVNIHCQENIRVGQTVTFSADANNITKFTPVNYFWDFGNGVKVKGQNGNVTFEKKGRYKIRCGTIADEDYSVKLCTFIYVDVE